jgi:hypothetical protein
MCLANDASHLVVANTGDTQSQKHPWQNGDERQKGKS